MKCPCCGYYDVHWNDLYERYECSACGWKSKCEEKNGSRNDSTTNRKKDKTTRNK